MKSFKRHCYKILINVNFVEGDIVAIGAPGDFGHMEPLLTGVVWSTKANSVTVAFDGKSDVHLVEDNTIYSLIKVANNVTYRRLKR